MAYKNKYQQEKQQYSVDGGTTWFDVTPPNYRKGRLLAVGHNGDDCNEPVILDGDYLTTEILGNGTIQIHRVYPTTSEIYQTIFPLTNIYYSKNNGEWTSISYDEDISVSVGDIIRWKANGNNSGNLFGTSYYVNGVPTINSSYVSTADYRAYGNPKSLIYSDNFQNTDETLKTVQFPALFNVNTTLYEPHLVDCENVYIPSNIGEYGCRYLFRMQKITTPPVLPATTMAVRCYESMFEGCTSLVTPPVLPATTLADFCYVSMFRNCTSLTAAPQLPATTLASGCYDSMFINCTSLGVAPELPARTMASQCYARMFVGCTSLTSAPELPATTLASGCYAFMFSGCRITSPPELPATTLASGCYEWMFQACKSLITAPELPATTLASYCYDSMFINCTSLVTAPQLTALVPANYCYRQMFSGCKMLKQIKCNLYNLSATQCVDHFLLNVAYNGNFIYNCNNNDWTTGDDGIPENWIRTCTN